jgi:predicted TIM-barrel enzyme
MDVVTTSGPGTGEAASVEKIRTMKNALGDFPLAIASGLTPENVGDFRDLADCFLVASGISSSWTDFDPVRIKDFVQAARSGKRQQ